MIIPKIIFTNRCIKNPARANAGKLVQYRGTREGVERLPGGIDHKPATEKQNTLVCDILKAYPEAMEYPEFQDYIKNGTKNNATECIDAFIERNADRVDGNKKLVSYIGERLGLERHGLFSQNDDKTDIDAIADEISDIKQSSGLMW